MLYNPEWSEKNKTKEVLLGAADLIRKHGLAKHIRRDDNGSYCIHGAVSQMISGDAMAFSNNAFPEVETMKHVVSYMRATGIVIDTRTDWVAAQWNNKTERTKEEVIAVLEGAAHAL